MNIKDMTPVNTDFPIADMDIRKLYYSKGIDGSADHTFYLRTSNYFVSGLAWNNSDGTVRLWEEKNKKPANQEHYCFALAYKSVRNLLAEEGYQVMAEFTVDGSSEIITGDSEGHNFVEHLFTGEPADYLPKIEPLLDILLESKKDERSYSFSVVTLSGDGKAAKIVVDGTINDSDDLYSIDSFGDILEDELAGVNPLHVNACNYNIGEGESDDLPYHLLESIEDYGTEDFVALDCVMSLTEHNFEVSPDEYII